MSKSEYLELLKKELSRNNISDIADIIAEYEQHFDFKLADGFSEEEIAAKLGSPELLAEQFIIETKDKVKSGSKAVATIGLSFTGILAGLFFLLLAAWGVVLFVFAFLCAAAAISLILDLNLWSLLPIMPLASKIIFGLALIALAVFSAAALVYFAAFLRQLVRAYGRFRQNTMAAATGNPILPALPITPYFKPEVRRRLRLLLLISLSIFATLLILGMIVSMVSSKSLGFWHTWGWFAY